jgi:hypothetical protein
MTGNDPILQEVATLLAHSLEGDLPADQFEYFKNLLQHNPRARACYYRLLSIQATLQEAESILILQDDSSETDYREAFNALSIEEKTAPAVEIPRQKPIKEIVSKIHYEKAPRTLSKSSIVTLAMSVAAILLIVLLLRFGPDPRIEVATVTSSNDVVFAGSKVFPVGSRLSSGTESLWLQKGAIEVTFDYGARVILEAPAHFNLNSAENIALHSGRLYAHVPERSKGFMVETPSSRVIDLGTEFGVKVDFDGSSDVYMMKGKASIFSGSKGQTGQGQILTAGEARRLDSKGNIETIPMREDEFAREFLLDGGLIWRGQDIDLADIVGGGCGLGTGRIEQSIDPATGAMAPWKIAHERVGTGRYNPVDGSVFIDGVFVPDGGNGPVQVTSSGLQWQSPDTTNALKYTIANTLRIPENLGEFKDYAGTVPKEDAILSKASEGTVSLRPLGLMGSDTPPGESDSSIFMHANSGITFNLDTIRNVLPNAHIVKFKSTFGIAEITDKSALLDVWVLVNGQPRFYRQYVTAEAVIDIGIDLSSGDRFLTLVVTDGEDQSNYGFDWGLFMNPRLEVE